MKEDGSLTPGSKIFWDDFYDKDDGRLIEKERDHYKTTEIKEGGSLLSHYEWFLDFSIYGPRFLDFLSSGIKDPSRSDYDFRLLHVGCGNSDFSSEFSEAASFYSFFEGKREIEILNMDICESLIRHLTNTFPERLYVVGNCCQMKPNNLLSAFDDRWVSPDAAVSGGDEWYRLNCENRDHPLLVQSHAVHTIFDKGTMDALLSAFPAEFNPNAQSYAGEAIRICMIGGIWYIISINAVELVDSYALSVSYENKSFRRIHQSNIFCSSKNVSSIRIETLGSVYRCYGYVAVLDEC